MYKRSGINLYGVKLRPHLLDRVQDFIAGDSFSTIFVDPAVELLPQILRLRILLSHGGELGPT